MTSNNMTSYDILNNWIFPLHYILLYSNNVKLWNLYSILYISIYLYILCLFFCIFFKYIFLFRIYFLHDILYIYTLL